MHFEWIHKCGTDWRLAVLFRQPVLRMVGVFGSQLATRSYILQIINIMQCDMSHLACGSSGNTYQQHWCLKVLINNFLDYCPCMCVFLVQLPWLLDEYLSITSTKLNRNVARILIFIQPSKFNTPITNLSHTHTFLSKENANFQNLGHKRLQNNHFNLQKSIKSVCI